MSEWKEVIATDFCVEVTDGTHDSPKPVSKGRYLLTSKHLQEYQLDFANAYQISQEDYEKAIARSKVDQYDVLFSMIGTIGITHRVSMAKVDFAVKNMGIFKMGGDEIKSMWLYYWLKTRKAKEYINSTLSGTTQGYITLKALRNFPIQVPNEGLMKSITSFLSSLDDKIAVNRRICENLEAQAQALFKHWFIDFAPFKNGKFVESELGMIPEGWRVAKFTDIFDLGSGGTPKTSEKLYWEDGSIPFFSPKDVNGVYCFDTEKHITEKGLNNCSSSLYSKNTVFITCRGTVGKVAMAAVPMAMNQSNYAILSNKGYSQFFAYLMTVSIVKKLKFKANGAVFDAITSKDFKEQIIIPNLNVVNSFDSIIQPIFDNILNIGFENLRLSTLRDTLLPKLMSGQIKV